LEANGRGLFQGTKLLNLNSRPTGHLPNRSEDLLSRQR
jgi:hypothetical protein